MAGPLATPGLKFFAEVVAATAPPTRLEPTMSTYGIWNLEERPKPNELYIVCQDGSIQSVYEPERPIGWELLEEPDGFYCRVTQMNHRPKRALVRFHSRVDDPPVGGRRIGSVVTFERRQNAETPYMARQDSPTFGEITYARDRDDEVTSRNLETIARNMNPGLAACAAFVGDPDQTDALARFAEGKMSYAEMRSRCG